MKDCLYPDRCLECPWVFTDRCLMCLKLEKLGLGQTPWGELRILEKKQVETAPAD